MKKTIAVEDELSNVVAALERAGYQVVGMDDPRWREANAVVIKGMDRDFMDVQDVSTRAPVIDASGLTAEQVLKTVEDRMALQGGHP
ncbi:MAG: YkuS family protein [Ignavibacteriales bacterium]